VDHAFEAMLLELLNVWQLCIPSSGRSTRKAFRSSSLTSDEERRIGDPLRRCSFYLRMEHPTAGREPEMVAMRSPDADGEFIEKHGMVVWRFHDHWHARKPDGIEAGIVHALRWEKFQNPDNQYLFVLPETIVKQLAQEVSKKLNSPVVRVVGDPQMKVTKVGFSPGAARFSKRKACSRARRCPGAYGRRDPRVGNGRICCRCGDRRAQQGTDRNRSHPE
jgi:hypothetical protein